VRNGDLIIGEGEEKRRTRPKAAEGAADRRRHAGGSGLESEAEILPLSSEADAAEAPTPHPLQRLDATLGGLVPSEAEHGGREAELAVPEAVCGRPNALETCNLGGPELPIPAGIARPAGQSLALLAGLEQEHGRDHAGVRRVGENRAHGSANLPKSLPDPSAQLLVPGAALSVRGVAVVARGGLGVDLRRPRGGGLRSARNDVGRRPRAAACASAARQGDGGRENWLGKATPADHGDAAAPSGSVGSSRAAGDATATAQVDAPMEMSKAPSSLSSSSSGSSGSSSSSRYSG